MTDAKTARGVEMISEETVSATFEIALTEPFYPNMNQRYHTPNLMELHGEPLYYIWCGSDFDLGLLAFNRVHKTRAQAFKQQESLRKLLYCALT